MSLENTIKFLIKISSSTPVIRIKTIDTTPIEIFCETSRPQIHPSTVVPRNWESLLHESADPFILIKHISYYSLLGVFVMVKDLIDDITSSLFS